MRQEAREAASQAGKLGGRREGRGKKKEGRAGGKGKRAGERGQRSATEEVRTVESAWEERVKRLLGRNWKGTKKRESWGQRVMVTSIRWERG